MLQFGDFPMQFKLRGGFIKWLRNKQQKGGAHAFERVKIRAIEHENRPGEMYEFKANWTFDNFAGKWHECPFDTLQEAEEFLAACKKYPLVFVETPDAWGEGKARELDAARYAAIWPEATDEELTAPGLEDRLKARLPGLLAEFKKAVEYFGFTF